MKLYIEMQASNLFIIILSIAQLIRILIELMGFTYELVLAVRCLSC